MTKSGIPLYIKIFGGFLVILGLFFTYSMFRDPNLIYPGATLVNATDAIKFGFFSAGTRAFAMVIAVLLAMISNRPKSMALVLIMRMVTEVLDGIVGYSLHSGTFFMSLVVVILILEAFCLTKLFMQINKEG